MFGFLRSLFGGGPGGRRRVRAPALPEVSRERLEHLWRRRHGLPRVDWGMANAWINNRGELGDDMDLARRAVMAACLDEMRDSLTVDHRRWRSAHIEGLAPLEGRLGHALAATADRACAMLLRDLRVVRGDRPLAPIAVVAVEPLSAYIDLTASYFPSAGETATSGGLYLNEGEEAFPLIAISATARHGCEATVAHELTHHALHDMGLPLWVEEGFTQMFEERVTGTTGFALGPEMISRHRAHWDEARLEEFLDGWAFSSARGETQELSYHLAQWVVRSELTVRPKAFFAFVRACGEEEPELACKRMLGEPLEEIVRRRLRRGA